MRARPATAGMSRSKTGSSGPGRQVLNLLRLADEAMIAHPEAVRADLLSLVDAYAADLYGTLAPCRTGKSPPASEDPSRPAPGLAARPAPGATSPAVRRTGEPVTMTTEAAAPAAPRRSDAGQVRLTDRDITGLPHPVGDDARRYRDILGQTMDAAGFINYPQEWWHWSDGDRYWAFQTSAEVTLNGPQ